ncbi:amine dehydrogenase large subunit [Paraglaciecola marina]|uniref:amine dehydrogenase large subunit n=1 Tax=Paraglaciecola marina TaxID=2500157 RepID=UPI00105EDA62|nr:amine dehydrogenase large subunit [Paraglaciecola marina]
MNNRLLKIVSALAFASLSLLVNAELKPEPIPSVTQLPADYPDSWIFAHDANFHALISGKVAIIDVAADTNEYKGFVDAAMMASFVESEKRSKLYVGETFYSRGTQGDKTDVLSIYDKSTLLKTKEIILPKANRGQMVSSKYMMQLVNDEKYLLLLAFTPASSVIVIDTKTEEIISEIPIPGCNLIYPAGKSGFASLCGNGGLKSVQFDEKGEVIVRYDIDSFFSVDDDPLFDKPVYIGSTAYFMSYKSRVQPIDMSKDRPILLPAWSLVTDEEMKENWRPGGWHFAASDNKRLLYVVMHKNGYNGSHKFGGEEVWVFNTTTHKRVKRIILKNNAFSIEVTKSKTPLLVVNNVSMTLDVYSVDGEFQRNITVSDTAMPIVLHSGK